MKVHEIKEILGNHFRYFSAHLTSSNGNKHKVTQFVVSTVFKKTLPFRFQLQYLEAIHKESDKSYYRVFFGFDHKSKSEDLYVEASKIVTPLLELFTKKLGQNIRSMVNELEIVYESGFVDIDTYNAPLTKEELNSKTHLFEGWIQEGTQALKHDSQKTTLSVVGKKGEMFKHLMVDEWGFMSLLQEIDGIYELAFKRELFTNDYYQKTTTELFHNKLKEINIPVI